MTKRRLLSLLPAYNQTDTLRKFFGATVDQLFQPGAADNISSYIGEKPPYYNPLTDFYLTESTVERAFYQLEPAMVSYDTSATLLESLTYPDLAAYLSTSGALTNDHQRLFETDSYAWGPPVNLDMMANPNLYYWFGDGTMPILSLTVPNVFYVGDGATSTFHVPDPLAVLDPSLAVCYVEGQLVAFTTQGSASAYTVTLANVPAAGSQVFFCWANDLYPCIQGKVIFDATALNSNGVGALSSGMRVRLRDGARILAGFDIAPFDDVAFDYSVDGIAGDVFWVDGVGQTIRLTPDSEMIYGGVTTTVIETLPSTTPAAGTTTGLVGYDAMPFEAVAFDDTTTSSTSGTASSGPTYGTTTLTTTSYSGLNAQYTTIDRSSVDQNGWSLRNSWSHRDCFAWAGIDATARQAQRPIVEFIRDIVRYQGSPQQAWDDQVAPLFALYDINGEALDGPAYPTSDFVGSRIFGYQNGDGVIDPVIRLPLVYDANGYAQFENDIATRPAHVSPNGAVIPGLYQYGVQGPNGIATVGVWYPRLIGSPVQMADAVTGLFPVAPGLKCNPTSLDVSITSQSSWTDHFDSIISGQTGFTGVSYAANNYRDGLRDLSQGTYVLQHRAPLLRVMLTASDENFDLPAAIRFVSREYGRFRNKFVRKILSLYHRGTIIPDAGTAWVSPALLATLNDLKLSLNSTFPFSGSTVGGAQFFIPPTPAVLGILPAALPAMVTDNSYGQPVVMIQGHDGSLTPAFLDWRDTLLLALETLIYDNMPQQFTSQQMTSWDGSTSYGPTEALPVFDIGSFVGNRLLGTPANGYSWDEAQSLLNPAFQAWAAQNGFEFRTYAGYDATDPFTWNYSSTQDRNGNALPGHWRGIYRAYYGTDRPHTAPWEMLGIVSKPDWWAAEYGNAPYLRSNTAMWGDIEAGTIRSGPRAPGDAARARPGLSAVIPVDAQGNLLNPLAARIVLRAPVYQQATQPWVAGDGSPAETFWCNTPDYRFALAGAAFLMKPARFVEECWDTLLTGYVGAQWVSLASATYGDRPQLATSYVHGEILADGTLAQATGIQQWLSDYIVSSGRSSSLLGDAMRGLDVRLGHRMAGFVSNEAVKAVADGFGLVPAEDVTVAFYQSPTLSEEVYSGAIVEWNGQGWRVVGYDAKKSSFTIIPPDTGSRKGVLTLASAQQPIITAWRPNAYWATNVYCEYQNSTYQCLRSHTSGAVFEQTYWTATPGVVQSQAARVTTYAKGLPGTMNVPYGTVYTSYQEVADFLLGFERYLVSRGWVFDGLDDKSGRVRNWSQAVLDFLGWAQVRWSTGNFIALSPGATGLHFENATGTILNVEDTTTGFFGMLDRSATAIPPRNATVSRLDGEIDLVARNADIFCARLHIADLEHILLFSNTTVFNDTIYLPLYGMRQARFKLIGHRTAEWAGRLDAPGYMVVGGKLVTNFEKMPEDIRLMFDIELADNPTLSTYARHVVGYQERDYLNELLLDDTQQFEFYQGQIGQKGTPGVLNKLLRSQRATENSTIVFLEEWAFRQSQYGAPQQSRLTLQLQQSSLRRDPQLVHFNDVANTTDPTWLEVEPNDPLWLDAPPASGLFFPQRTDYAPSVLPTAGPVRLSDTQYVAFNAAGLATTYTNALATQATVFNAGERVWIYDGLDLTYTVIRAFDLGSAPNQLIKILTSGETSSLVDECLIIMTSLHDLTTADIGSILVIDGLTGATPEIQGIAVLSSVPSDGYTLGVSGGGTQGADFTTMVAAAPVVRIMRRVRFPDLASLRLSTLAWADGDMAWVDGTSTTPWTVYGFLGGIWSVLRIQPNRCDATRIAEVALYDTSVRLAGLPSGTATINEPLVSDVVVVDPIAGLLPGLCEREIDFRTPYDPAHYTGGQTWGSAQVGRVWWDLSTTRFIDPCTDVLGQGRDAAELAYRAANWAQVAPLSSVDVYEWTASQYTPSEYAENFSISDAPSGSVSTYPGVVYNVGDPSWVEESVYDPVSGVQTTMNYFWLSGLNTIPPVAFRETAITTVAQGITSPVSLDLPWLAPIAADAMLVSGVSQFLNDTSTTLMVELVPTTDTGDHTHDQWALIRPYDPRSLPPEWLWRKVRDGLGAFDDTLSPLPGNVHPTRATGLYAGQNVFQIAGQDGPRSGLMDARRAFVATVNRLLYALPVVVDRASLVATLSRRSPIGTLVTNGNAQQVSLIWSRPDESYLIEAPPPSEYDSRFVVRDADARNRLLVRPEFLNATAPISVLLDARASSLPSWSIWVYDPAAVSGVFASLLAVSDAQAASDPLAARIVHAERLFTLKTAYDAQVGTYAELADLATNAPTLGYRVLVDPHLTDPNSYDFWGLYTYVGVSEENANGFALTRAQDYDTSAFISARDWYSPGYTRYNAPSVVYASETARDLAEGASPTNLFVLVQNDSYGQGWIWTVYQSFVDEEGATVLAWVVVAREAGTLVLSSAFYDPTRVVHGLGAPTLSDVAARDGSFEIRALAQTLAYGGILLPLEFNEVFFSLVAFVHAQQDDVDWVFKTSFLNIAGYNVPLAQTPVTTLDETANLVAFVNEVKPYRVKVRDTSTQYSTDIDRLRVHTTDFDKPPYFDAPYDTYRTLNISKPFDAAILASNAACKDWYGIYAQPNSPVRSFKINLTFDRITDALSLTACADAVLHSLSDNETQNPNDGAETRINAYYAANSEPMPDLSTLLDTGFQGTRVDGESMASLVYPCGDFDAGPCGFDTLPYDSTIDVNPQLLVDGNDSPAASATQVNPTVGGKFAGYGLADPYVNPGHPEERVLANADDTLVIIATDQQSDGTTGPAWIMATTTGAQARMTPLTSHGSPVTAVPAGSAGVAMAVWKQAKSWEWVRISQTAAGTLAVALAPGDLAIQVIRSGGDPMPKPDPKRNKPGVIWISGERIEFFAISNASGLATLGQLRRGTHGTVPVAQPAGTLVVNGMLTNVFNANNLDIPLMNLPA